MSVATSSARARSIRGTAATGSGWRSSARSATSPRTRAATVAQEIAIEVIVVDNGSSDETPSLLRQWQSAQFFPVRLVHEERPGLARARIWPLLSGERLDRARRAAAAHAADLVASGARAAYAAVRPPGHHAGPAFYGGSCYFNNAAAAAQRLRDRRLERVAIVDIDAHQGNGTQEIFWDEPGVLYVSTHQWPLYPGTGRASEVGTGAGVGTTMNIPLPAGATGDVYLAAFDAVVAHVPPPLYDPAADLQALVCNLDASPYGGRPALCRGQPPQRQRPLPGLWFADGPVRTKDRGGGVATALRRPSPRTPLVRGIAPGRHSERSPRS